MSSERVPLLSAQAQYSPIEASTIQPPRQVCILMLFKVQDPVPKSTISRAEVPQQLNNVISEQVQTKPESNEKPENSGKPESSENAGSSEKKEEPVPQNRPVATEGFLARCGGCLV